MVLAVKKKCIDGEKKNKKAEDDDDLFAEDTPKAEKPQETSPATPKSKKPVGGVSVFNPAMMLPGAKKPSFKKKGFKSMANPGNLFLLPKTYRTPFLGGGEAGQDSKN